jgi:hypothetical protein
VSLFPPQILHGLAVDRSRGPAVIKTRRSLKEIQRGRGR